MAASGRARGALFLIASILGAAGVTLIVFNMIQSIRSRSTEQRPEEKTKVVVASVDIAPGWTITPEMLQEREMARSYVPREAIKEADAVVGRVAMERVLYGEFIRDERLASADAGMGLPAIIPRGMRAYQVSANGGQGMSGFLNPGNFVDVIAVCTDVVPPDVRTILKSATVLAVNDKMVDDSYTNPSEPAPTGKRKRAKKVKPSVTLALTPQDTVLIKHADEECEIYLALRNDIDVTNIETNDEVTPAGVASNGPAEPLDVEVSVGVPPTAEAPAPDAPPPAAATP
ncbi:MAG TPA: Flp pilus assembly protein CpaB [Myxococcota bacterium]|nr:Flp pilus assembly protein CpaB [Myxococcota bacterium]